MRTVKAQIRLHIRAVWSEPSLSANWTIGYYRMYEWRAKVRMVICSCAGWSESVHFAHIWRHFCTWRRPNDGIIKSILGKIFRWRHFEIFVFKKKNTLDISCKMPPKEIICVKFFFFFFREKIRKFISFVTYWICLEREVRINVLQRKTCVFLGMCPPQWLSWMRVRWWSRGCGFDHSKVRQHSFLRIDKEIFSTVILSLPLVQERQLYTNWLTA